MAPWASVEPEASAFPAPPQDPRVGVPNDAGISATHTHA